MKRILSVGMLAVLLTLTMLSAVSCGERVPDGTYSCIAADTGEQYIFEGGRVRVILYIMGEVAIAYSGTYKLSGETITLNFPEDTDAIYSGTFSYESAADGSTIKLGGVTFERE